MKNRLRFFVEKIGKGDESLKTKCALIVAAVVIFISCVIVIFYGYRKSGFFLDEIYSYGLSNSHYAPFLRDVKDGEIREKVFLRQELLDYVTVGKIKFDYKSVYYNQTRDVHPPFYYWILNMISSVFPFTFSKWIGIGVNLIFFVITLASLFFLTYKMFDDYRISGVVAVLYGTSKAAISTAVMIRMYMLMTMFTVLLTLCVYEIREGEKRRKILFPIL
ncbi:MAG: glycosyltransferase family 39 protein [Lachnospiraceae bacterium]|nr:glycosyltransferase family 39 protein [Lachnospiraceae bacterium]